MAKKRKDSSRIDAERVRLAIQSQVNPIRGLTAERLVDALENFSRGYLRDASVLWQQIRERDDTTISVTQKRDLDCSLLDWEILPEDDSPEATKHKEALEAAYNGLTATDALDQNKHGGVSGLINAMMHAVGHKWAVFEIIWDPSGADLTAEFRFVPLQFFENTLGRLRFLAQEGNWQGEDLEEGGWMVVCGPGLMQATSIAYFIKRSPMQAWAILCDKFAVPYLHGQTSAAKDSPEWKDFRDALAAFVSDGAVLTSENGKITPIQITGAEAPAEKLVDRADRGITRIWRGADLGTMSKDGQAVGANPQESETDILSAADAMMISETLNYHFDRLVIRYRFGTEPKAYFKLKPRTKVNQQLQLTIDEKLIAWGVPVSKKSLHERYGRPEPDKGEELAGQQAAAKPAPGASEITDPKSQIAAGAEREERESLANEANLMTFVARSAAKVEPAQREALMPILSQLARIDALTDTSAQLAALEQFRTDWPLMARDAIKRVPALAAVFEKINGSAFISGYAEHARANPGTAMANSPRSGYHDLRDELGRFAPEGGGDPDPDQNEALGRKALDIAERRKGDVKSAMYREQIGAIDFEQGTPGDASKDFEGGHGLEHIRAKHPKALTALPRIIARGTVTPHPDDPANKWLITHELGLASIARRSGARGGLITSYAPRT